MRGSSGPAGCLVYIAVIWWKASLTLIDAGVLIAIYVGVSAGAERMPPEDAEASRIWSDSAHDRARAAAGPDRGDRRAVLGGGALIYFTAEPFWRACWRSRPRSAFPSFVFVQWVAPLVSEFPEKVSAFYWARTVERASMALMNMVSSNINQWTLLAAMLPIVVFAEPGPPCGHRIPTASSSSNC